MFGRSFHRLCENASSYQFTNIVIVPILHVLLVGLALLIQHPWAAIFWAVALIGDAVRLDAHLVYEDGVKSVSNIGALVIVGGMCAQLLAIMCLILGI